MKVVLASVAEADVIEADAQWRQHRDEKNLFEDELTAALGLLATSPGVGQRVSRSGLLVRRLTQRRTSHRADPSGEGRHGPRSLPWPGMSRIAQGKVVDGRVVVEGEPLPEGARVTVVMGDEAEWEIDEASVQELLQAAAEADQEEGVSAEELFAELRAMR